MICGQPVQTACRIIKTFDPLWVCCAAYSSSLICVVSFDSTNYNNRFSILPIVCLTIGEIIAQSLVH